MALFGRKDLAKVYEALILGNIGRYKPELVDVSFRTQDHYSDVLPRITSIDDAIEVKNGEPDIADKWLKPVGKRLASQYLILDYAFRPGEESRPQATIPEILGVVACTFNSEGNLEYRTKETPNHLLTQIGLRVRDLLPHVARVRLAMPNLNEVDGAAAQRLIGSGKPVKAYLIEGNRVSGRTKVKYFKLDAA
jgi:hypothetical protein